MPLNRPCRILIVDDNPGDILLFRESFRRVAAAINVFEMSAGDRALQFLRGEGEYEGSPAPDLILLDLNMPGLDGRQVLAAIKQDRALRRTPLIVVSSTRDPHDVEYVYDNGANAMISKPDDLDGFIDVCQMIYQFWLRLATTVVGGWVKPSFTHTEASTGLSPTAPSALHSLRVGTELTAPPKEPRRKHGTSRL